MGDIELFGVVGATLVTLIVQMAKTLHLPTSFAPIASLVAGFMVSGAYMWHTYDPANADPWLRFGVLGLLLGLSGSGLHSQSQAMQDLVKKRKAAKMLAAAPPESKAVVVSGDILPQTGVVVAPGPVDADTVTEIHGGRTDRETTIPKSANISTGV